MKAGPFPAKASNGLRARGDKRPLGRLPSRSVASWLSIICRRASRAARSLATFDVSLSRRAIRSRCRSMRSCCARNSLRNQVSSSGVSEIFAHGHTTPHEVVGFADRIFRRETAAQCGQAPTPSGETAPSMPTWYPTAGRTGGQQIAN